MRVTLLDDHYEGILGSGSLVLSESLEQMRIATVDETKAVEVLAQYILGTGRSVGKCRLNFQENN